jgi:competence protein ComEA
MTPSHPQFRAPRAPLLKRVDQAAVAALMMIALASASLYVSLRGGLSGRLIEIDRAPRQTVQFQLDINEADWPEFTVLPGVGETLARRIVESRAKEGRFADIDDLARVRGIGPKTLEEIRPYLRPVPSSGAVADQ